MRYLVAFMVLLLAVGCLPGQPKREFATEDILPLNLTSEDISFYGISLGDSINDVTAVFGEPDRRNELILEGVTNLEYGENINLTDNGLIFHFENGTLTRMTIKKTFTDFYQTKTQLNFTKREAYEWIGLPDRQSTVLNYRVFTYERKGIDLFLKGRDANRISFFVRLHPEMTSKNR